MSAPVAESLHVPLPFAPELTLVAPAVAVQTKKACAHTPAEAELLRDMVQVREHMGSRPGRCQDERWRNDQLYLRDMLVGVEGSWFDSRLEEADHTATAEVEVAVRCCSLAVVGDQTQWVLVAVLHTKLEVAGSACRDLDMVHDVDSRVSIRDVEVACA